MEWRGCDPPAIKAAVKILSRNGWVGNPKPPAKKRNRGSAKEIPKPSPYMMSNKIRVRRDLQTPDTATSCAAWGETGFSYLRSPVGINGISRFSMARSKIKVTMVIKTRYERSWSRLYKKNASRIKGFISNIFHVHKISSINDNNFFVPIASFSSSAYTGW